MAEREGTIVRLARCSSIVSASPLDEDARNNNVDVLKPPDVEARPDGRARRPRLDAQPPGGVTPVAKVDAARVFKRRTTRRVRAASGTRHRNHAADHAWSQMKRPGSLTTPFMRGLREEARQ